MIHRRRQMLGLLASLPLPLVHAATPGTERPVIIAINAEYGVANSHAAQSIEKGVALAVAEINEKGGLIGGRPLRIERRDDRGVPARSIDNMRDLANNPDVVAVFCGRFSPVALELTAVTHELGMILLNPWAAADGIANNGLQPNPVFRLSMTDTWAIETMLANARRRGFKRLTALLPNTAWGRSSQAAIQRDIKSRPGLKVTETWYNWGDTQYGEQLVTARQSRSDALLLVANETEGKHLLNQINALPKEERLPIIAHWGITAGDFNRATNGLASELDLQTVQTFAFPAKPSAQQQQWLANAIRHLGEDPRKLHALVGFAHAYDLTHLLAKAITKANSTRRPDVRNALEHLDSHQGLVRHYRRPFTPKEHEALDRQQVFMARYDRSGMLVRVDER